MVRRSGYRCAAVAAFAFLAGCGGEAAEPTWSAATPAPFTLLGRWAGESEIVYACRAAESDPPLDAAAAEAIAIWSETRRIAFRKARAGEEPDLVISFESGRHGECVPFTYDVGMAHAGPRRPPTWVHLDRARDWSPAGYSLQQAIAHELGHVLGIGHTEDESALMYPVPDRSRTALSAVDRAALYTLYGGGEIGPADLVVHRGEHELPLAVLYGVAPPATTAFTAVDTDGDGDDELLVWRTDREGYGALTIFHCDAGPALARTVGPLPGVAVPGRPHIAGSAASGERVFVTLLADGRWLARAFDEDGLPQVRPAGAPLELGPWRDADGDGSWDAGHPDAEAFTAPAALRVDLDGDGRTETVHRG